MAKFIELNRMAWTNNEKSVAIQNVDDISMVFPQGGDVIIMLRRSMGDGGEACYRVAESYEEVKRMLLGSAAQRVPWEAD